MKARYGKVYKTRLGNKAIVTHVYLNDRFDADVTDRYGTFSCEYLPYGQAIGKDMDGHDVDMNEWEESVTIRGKQYEVSEGQLDRIELILGDLKND